MIVPGTSELGPDLILLDVNETLTDLAPIADVFARVGAPGSLSSRWFAAILQNGFAQSMAGTPRPFAEVATAVLPGLLQGEHLPMSLDRATRAVVDSFGELPLHPDVADGLRAMHEAGLRIATLSNGGAAYTRMLLEREGLTDLVEATLSVENAPAWKPDPRAYSWALERLQVQPSRALMVAVHPWDLHGAQVAGLRTAWIDRSGAPYPSLGRPPELACGSLVELADLFG